MPARVFTIPASAPFLPTLIEALFGGKLGFAPAADPLALASATLYLPTRRACRLARDAFLDRLRGDAAILPRIVALGDIDEDEIAFAEAAAGGIAADALALPPALGGLERRLLLTKLIVKWVNSPELHGQSSSPLVAQTPAAACALADDLARLIDDMTTRGVPWKRLDNLVPDQFDEYWKLTLRFLKIAGDNWPKILDDLGQIEPAKRRDALIKAEAARLSSKTDGPVIAAGSTGSIPSTAELIATIAHLPHGAVVLPGLDTDLDEASWRLISGDPKKKIPAVARPSAVCHAGAADAHWHPPQRSELAGKGGRPRSPAVRSDAPRHANRCLVGARQRSGVRRAGRCRGFDGDSDRGRQRRGRSAVDRNSAARSGTGRQNRRVGHTGPDAGTPCRRGADALEYRGGRYRRCSACRNTGRDFCPTRGGSRRRQP